MLFDSVRSRLAAELTAGKLDRSLDVLELAERFSSRQPCGLYALYLNRRLMSRAKEFRNTARERAPSFNLDIFFDRIDKNPTE